MKYILSFMLLLVVGCGYGQDCKKYTAISDSSEGAWRIAYNPYYKKYAVRRGNDFLLKDHYGDYGVYGEDWFETSECGSCGDKKTSLFIDPCDAKQFLINYIRKLKTDKWN